MYVAGGLCIRLKNVASSLRVVVDALGALGLINVSRIKLVRKRRAWWIQVLIVVFEGRLASK